MRLKKRILSLVLCAVLAAGMMFAAAGCSSGSSGGSSENPGTIVSETDKDLTIVDQAGREVTVPKDVKSTAFCYRVVCRFIMSLDKGDTIKGMGKHEEFLDYVQPSLKDAKDVGQGVVDIEALAELAPQLFIHKANDPESLDSVQELGIPAVGISVETPDEMITALDILGKVLSSEKKADKLIKYYRNKLKIDKRLVAEIKEKNKKSAVVMGSSIGKVADGSMLQGFMIEAAGGLNAARELDATETWPSVGTEQIFEWDPDYIFISGSESANYSPDDILKDKTWSDVSAVKDNNVYVIPASEDSWEFPGVVSVLGIDYMINRMYPELLSGSQLKKNIDEFYKLSYGRIFTLKEIGY